jgi:hypothetical protein
MGRNDETATDARDVVSGSDETLADSSPGSPTVARPTIGRFVIDRELGAGGMGIVYAAHDPTLDRPVAIKLLRDDRATSSTARMRLLREAQAMARLRHSNVVTVYEAGVHEGHVFLVMELLTGGTLRERLVHAKTSDLLRLHIEAGRGLAAAHRAGLVHRDFKPSNVLIDETDHAKVTDFGLAVQDDSAERVVVRTGDRASEPDLDALAHSLTRTGDMLGTPRYMPPEQFEGKDPDPRADQLYEALYGRHPFRDESLEALRASILDDDPQSPDPGPAGSRVRDAILHGLSRHPGNRFASMDELLAALAPPRRSRWPLIGAGAGIAIGIAVAVAVLAARPVHLVKDRATEAKRAALACDCEMVELQLPPGARVIGTRDALPETVGPLLAPIWLPTGQLGVSRGQHVVEYAVGDARYDYAMISRGQAFSRTLFIPAPEDRAGFVFVPGGEVALVGAGTTLQMPPFFVERTSRDVLTHADALALSFDKHARLVTAAEWEWATRLGVIDRSGQWEWTASDFVTYPLGPGPRDDELADRDRSEVRGGGPRLESRMAGAHTGKARVRFARDIKARLLLEPVKIQIKEVARRDDPTRTKYDVVVPPEEREKVDAFVTAWRQHDVPPALLVDEYACQIDAVLQDDGVPLVRVEGRHGDQTTNESTLRVNPDPTFVHEDGTPQACRSSTTTILASICFEGDKLDPGSLKFIAAMTDTINSRPDIKLLEVRGYADTDSTTLAQKRAEIVRAKMVQFGLAAKRVVAKGYINLDDGPDHNHGLFTDSIAPPMPPGCPTPRPGETVDFKVLDPPDFKNF